ncbi:FAS1-like dehydratase domain-containing protein [Micromonospora rubida]
MAVAPPGNLAAANPAVSPAAPAEDSLAYLERLRSVIGKRGEPRRAKDPVSEPIIRIWCDAVGDDNPAYQDPAWAQRSRFGGITAPATTLNMWTLPGNRRAHRYGEPLDIVTEILAERGFTSVAAVNNNHEYVRPLRPGDHLSQIQHIGAVSEEKQTALGQGHFVDLVSEYVTETGELVGRVLLRMLRWNPSTRQGTPADDSSAVDRLQPISRPRTQAVPTRSGIGTVRSFLQPVYAVEPTEERPFVVADVELADGTTVVSDLLNVEPQAVHVGMRVDVLTRETRTGELLPVFQPARPARRVDTITFADVEPGMVLAPWPVPLTQLSIAALATATFDFNDVHLDRDAALRRGARDVYMNILGSTGLVNCFLTDWAGPEAVLKAIQVRLQKQNFPGDTLTLVGTVSDKRLQDGAGLVDVAVRGYNSLGDHLVARCTLDLPVT